MTAHRVADLEPGTPAWLRVVSASKVPAILGLSPWDSRFSLWHRMRGEVAATKETPTTERGHYLETAVGLWWADKHPSVRVELPGGTWVSDKNPLHVASPDGRVLNGNTLIGPLEVKTAADPTEWGEDGTDEIPPYYRAQLVWQMRILDARVGFVAALLGPRLQLRAYTVLYDADEADWMAEQVDEFLASLHAGRRPDIDEHTQTYEAIRELHPDIDGGEFEVPDDLAVEFTQTARAAKRAKDAADRARNRLFDAMGTAQYAVYGRHTLARRQARVGGEPYLVADKRLPVIQPFAETERAS